MASPLAGSSRQRAATPLGLLSKSTMASSPLVVNPSRCPHCSAILTPSAASLGATMEDDNGEGWWERCGGEGSMRRAQTLLGEDDVDADAAHSIRSLMHLTTTLSSRLQSSYAQHHDLTTQLKVAKSNLILAEASAEVIEENVRLNALASRRFEGGHSRTDSANSHTSSPGLVSTLWRRTQPQPPPPPSGAAGRRGTISGSTSDRDLQYLSSPASHFLPSPTPSIEFGSPMERSNSGSLLISKSPLAMSAELAKTKQSLAEAQAQKQAVEDELETLSQALFEEANRMVADEKRSRVAAEREIELLKAQLDSVMMKRSRTESASVDGTIAVGSLSTAESSRAPSPAEGWNGGSTKRWFSNFGRRKPASDASVSMLHPMPVESKPVAIRQSSFSESEIDGMDDTLTSDYSLGDDEGEAETTSPEMLQERHSFTASGATIEETPRIDPTGLPVPGRMSLDSAASQSEDYESLAVDVDVADRKKPKPKALDLSQVQPASSTLDSPTSSSAGTKLANRSARILSPNDARPLVYASPGTLTHESNTSTVPTLYHSDTSSSVSEDASFPEHVQSCNEPMTLNVIVHDDEVALVTKSSVKIQEGSIMDKRGHPLPKMDFKKEGVFSMNEFQCQVVDADGQFLVTPNTCGSVGSSHGSSSGGSGECKSPLEVDLDALMASIVSCAEGLGMEDELKQLELE